MNNITEAKKKLEQHGIDQNYADYIDKYLENKNDYDVAIDKLIAGIPVQYIVGNVDFYGLKFKVNSNVLIPRFETEELVEKTINYIKKMFKHEVSILDIGTGSGCIAITMKSKLPNSDVSAVDISLKALDVAGVNADLNNCVINFINSDLLDNVDNKFDVIISNPPYISKSETVMALVNNNEPHLALYAENDGYYCYEQILKNASKNLKDKYLIAFEIGETQGTTIKNIASTYFQNAEVIVEKDLQNRDRFIFIIKI